MRTSGNRFPARYSAKFRAFGPDFFTECAMTGAAHHSPHGRLDSGPCGTIPRPFRGAVPIWDFHFGPPARFSIHLPSSFWSREMHFFRGGRLRTAANSSATSSRSSLAAPASATDSPGCTRARSGTGALRWTETGPAAAFQSGGRVATGPPAGVACSSLAVSRSGAGR